VELPATGSSDGNDAGERTFVDDPAAEATAAADGFAAPLAVVAPTADGAPPPAKSVLAAVASDDPLGSCKYIPPPTPVN
jgi:hypothetical protein